MNELNEVEIWEAFYRNLQVAAQETSDLIRSVADYLPPLQRQLLTIELTQIAKRLTDKQMSVHSDMAIRVLSTDPKRWEELVFAARANSTTP